MDSLRAAGCVFAEEEAAILTEAAESEAAESGAGPGAADERLAALLARRAAGEPLEQIVGWVDFAGRRLRVVPGVFVPRQRTTLLAQLSVRALQETAVSHTDQSPRQRGPSSPPRFLEAFCGVGPVAATVAGVLPEVEVHLGDADVHALSCALDNAEDAAAVAAKAAGAAADAAAKAAGAAYAAEPLTIGSKRSVEGHELDCLIGLPGTLRESFDVISAVPPYVPDSAAGFLPREALDHESPGALFGGADGLDLVRRLIEESEDWLSPRGRLLIEVGRDQAPIVEEFARARGRNAEGHLGEDEITVIVEVARKL